MAPDTGSRGAAPSLRLPLAARTPPNTTRASPGTSTRGKPRLPWWRPEKGSPRSLDGLPRSRAHRAWRSRRSIGHGPVPMAIVMAPVGGPASLPSGSTGTEPRNQPADSQHPLGAETRPSANEGGVPSSQTACLGQSASRRDVHQGQRPMALRLSCYRLIRSDH